MKKFTRLFLGLMVATTLLMSACGGAIASPVAETTSLGANKPLASFIEVQGYIEEINGSQWTVNGQVVTLEPSMLNNSELANYQVGDYIEIKVEVIADGSLVVREIGSSDDGNTNDDSNSNDDDDSNSNDDDDSNSNDDDDSNSNDDDDSNSNGDDDSNSNDDDSNSNDDDSNSNDDDSNSNDDDSNSNDDSSNEND